MSRVLQVNSFPTVTPRHGGQRRAHQIGRMLEQAGHAVSRVAAYTFSGYGSAPSEPAIDLDRFPRPSKPTTWLYDGVRAMADDAEALTDFATLCERSDPEIILVEEVWLWPVIRQLAMVRSDRVAIIYNSYNIEAPLFRRVLTDLGHDDSVTLSNDVSALEADLARRAQACSAVTQEDAASLRALGARRVVVAPNGVERRDRAHLKGALPDGLSPDFHYVLYVASSHPPNASGIPDLFEAIFASLRPLERLVAVGGVCQLLAEWLRDGGPAHLARERMVLLGEVTDWCLDGLIDNAAGIVLPLREGGGSNLKTAEALYSRLPVVATTVAMRGYEVFRGIDGLVVADEPAAFAAGMRQALDGLLPRRAPGGALDSLVWENTLLPIVELVEGAIPERASTEDGGGRTGRGHHVEGG